MLIIFNGEGLLCAFLKSKIEQRVPRVIEEDTKKNREAELSSAVCSRVIN